MSDGYERRDEVRKGVREVIKSLDELRGMRGNYATYEDLIMRCYDIADEIEREVESNYIELPKDANGEVWRVGDLVVGETNPNNPKRVERMLWYGPDSGWQLETDTIIYPCPERARNYHAPTVEDVLEEALNRAANLDRKEGYWPSAADITNIVNEVAPKLQLRKEQ